MLGGGAFDPDGGRPRRVAVLGDMLELGDASREAHLEIAARVAADPGIDAGVFVGDAFASAFTAQGAGTAVYPGGDAGAGDVAAGVRAGDVVLLKGSRGMRLERLIEALRERAAVAPDR